MHELAITESVVTAVTDEGDGKPLRIVHVLATRGDGLGTWYAWPPDSLRGRAAAR